MHIVLNYTAGMGRFYLYLDPNAAILHFGVSKDAAPTIWVQEDPNARKTLTWFQLIETGRCVDDSEKLQYVGTCISDWFVYHLYKELS